MATITILNTLIIACIVISNLYRGSGPALFRLVCIAVGGIFASVLAMAISPAVHLLVRADAIANEGWWRLILLALFIIPAFPIGTYLHRFYPFTFDPFDWVLALALGCVAAFLVTRYFLSAVEMAYHGTPMLATIDHLFLVRQVVHLEGWHGMNAWFSNIHPREVSTPQD